MQHYVARQLKGSLKWHFCCGNYPVGYCAHHGGHDTKEEAEACYADYMLKEGANLNNHDSHSQRKCKECGAWTNRFATVGGYNMYFLCDEHCTIEILRKHYGIPTEFWQS